MATLSTRLQDLEYQLWIKAGLCVCLVKEGLESFANDTSNELHKAVIDELKKNSNPAVHGICGSACISYSRAMRKWEIDCCSNCQGFVDELHRYCCMTLGTSQNKPFTFRQSNFDNADIHSWPTEPWQLAKVFMNPGQSISYTSPRETDLSGILNFIDHCVIPRTYIAVTSNISKVRDSRNKIMHCATLKLSSNDFTSLTDAMVDLLEDKLVLNGMQDSIDAVKRIREIQTSSLPIRADDEMKVLGDQTAQLLKYNEELRDDIREIRVSLNKLKQSTEEECKHTKDQLQNEVKLREDAMNKVFSILGNVRRLISQDETLCQQLDSHVRTLHQSLEDTRRDLQYTQRELEALAVRLSTVEDRVDNIMNDMKDIKQLPDKTEHKTFDKEYQAFQQYIVEEYRRMYHEVSLSPVYEGLDEHVLKSSIDKFYTEIKIVKPDGKGEYEVDSCKDIFSDGDSRNRTIFIKGDAGIGKSTWCLHLLRAWCAAHSFYSKKPKKSVHLTIFKKCLFGPDRSGKGRTDDLASCSADSIGLVTKDMQEAVAHFDFLFFIPLRYARGKSSISDLVFFSTLQRFSNFNSVYNRLLKEFSEKVLFLLDGYDEYDTHLDFQGLNQSTVVITARPWKYDSVCLTNPIIKPDLVLSIKGLNSDGVRELIEKVLKVLASTEHQEENNAASSDVEQTDRCLNQLMSTGFGESVKYPLILLSLVQYWFENGKSLSSSFTRNVINLVRLLILRGKTKLQLLRTDIVAINATSMKRLNKEIKIPSFQGVEVFLEFENLILQLGELAFEGLITSEKATTLVFTANELKKHISATDINVCFKLGLLSESVNFTSYLEQRNVYVSFGHKLMQEMFAALWIVSSENALHKFMEHLTCVEKILEVENITRFVCGLAPCSAANLVSHFAEICNADKSVLQFREDQSFKGSNTLIENFTKMILGCQTEIDQSLSPDEEVFLTDGLFYEFEDSMTKIIEHSERYLKSVGLYYLSLSNNQLLELIQSVNKAISLEKIEVVTLKSNRSDEEPKHDVKLDFSKHDQLKQLKIQDTSSQIDAVSLGNNNKLEQLVCIGVKLSEPSWNNFFKSLETQTLTNLYLQHVDVRDTSVSLQTCTGLQKIRLDNMSVLEIRLGTALNLERLEIFNISMPEASWNILFSTLQSSCLRKLALWHLHAENLVINIENIAQLDLLEMRNVIISSITLNRYVSLQRIFLFNVAMSRLAWNPFFESLRSPMLISLTLAELYIDEAVVNVEHIKQLERLHVHDAYLSDIKIGNEIEINKVSLQYLTMQRSSWFSFFKDAQASRIRNLLLGSFSIDETVVDLQNWTHLKALSINDVDLLEIKLAKNKSLENISLINVVMPQTAWYTFFESVKTLGLRALSVEILNTGEASLDLANNIQLKYLKILDVQMNALRLGSSMAVEEIWIDKLDMPMVSWSIFFKSLSSKSLRSLTLSNLNAVDVLFDLSICVAMEILKINRVRMKGLNLHANVALHTLEMESVSMLKSSWVKFFEQLCSQNLRSLFLDTLDIGKAVINIDDRTKLQKLTVIRVNMSKICYKHLTAVKAGSKHLHNIKVNGKRVDG